MSKEYLNVVSPRNGKEGKTEWHRVGVAFRNDNKPDIPYSIVLYRIILYYMMLCYAIFYHIVS